MPERHNVFLSGSDELQDAVMRNKWRVTSNGPHGQSGFFFGIHFEPRELSPSESGGERGINSPSE
jgi:hypothetical protein